MFGFLGPNGAGKTTTLKMLMGLIFPARGRAEVLGAHGAQPWSAKRRLGYLPESPYFYEYLTAEEFLDLVGALFDLPAAERRRRAERLIARVGLDHARGRPLRKFSKGMLQRVGIAQALMGDPELVVLDEPMTGLDPLGRKEIRDLILELKREGRTVFFSTHILPDVEMTCDRVAMIFAGQHPQRRAAARAAVGAPAVDRGGAAAGRGRRAGAARGGAPRQTPTGVAGRAARGGRRGRLPEGGAGRGGQRAVGVAAPRVAGGPLRARGQAGPAPPRGRRRGAHREADLGHRPQHLPRGGANKILYSLLFFAVLIILSALAVGQLSLHEEVRMTRDVGLFGIDIFGVIIAIFVGVNLLYKELDLKTVYTILPKPLRRWEFVLGKWLGMLLTLAVQMVVMGVVLAVTWPLAGRAASTCRSPRRCGCSSSTSWWSPRWRCCSRSFSSPFPVGFFALGFFVVGRSVPDIRALGERVGAGARWCCDVRATWSRTCTSFIPRAPSSAPRRCRCTATSWARITFCRPPATGWAIRWPCWCWPC